jgi:hypothetical protein
MTISRRTSFILWLLIVSFANSAAAMTVYMNDESEIEAQSAWKDGETVYVRMNPELCLDFPASEVNVRKSGIPIVQQKRTSKAEQRVMASTPSGEIVDELIVAAGHRRDLNDIFGRSGRDEIDQLFADTLSPDRAEKTLRSCLVRKLGNRELAAVLTWYKSPVGAKIVEADSVWDFNREEKAAAYASLDSAPGFKERMKLIGQIEEIAGASEIQTRLTQGVLRKMISDIPPDFPDAREIKERLRKEIPSLEMSRKKNVQDLVYNYRFLSTHELREYLQFLRSAPGKKYTAAVSVASEEIFKKVAMNIEKDFRAYVKMLAP